MSDGRGLTTVGAGPAEHTGRRRGLPQQSRRAHVPLLRRRAGRRPGAAVRHAAMFAAQLEHLRRRGWQALSLDGYLAALDGAPTPRRSYLLTIDDGHESRRRHRRADARRRRDAVGAVRVPGLARRPGAVGGVPTRSERLLPPSSFAACPELGMELGVHSWDHTRMVGMDDDALRAAGTPCTRRAGGRDRRVGPSLRLPLRHPRPAARAAVAAAGYRRGVRRRARARPVRGGPGVRPEHGFPARVPAQAVARISARVPRGRARMAAAAPRASRGRTGTDDAAVPIRFEMTWRGNEAASRGDGELANEAWQRSAQRRGVDVSERPVEVANPRRPHSGARRPIDVVPAQECGRQSTACPPMRCGTRSTASPRCGAARIDGSPRMRRAPSGDVAAQVARRTIDIVVLLGAAHPLRSRWC